MSQLRLTSFDNKEFKLNVTQFRSPMSAAITSVQTRKMMQHFAIRCGQPDINFTVRYASMKDKHEFESFVRRHMLESQDEKDAEVSLWWPERNIENWTGFITQYSVIERRFETAPAATFGVSLVDSMMSEKTTIATRIIDVWKILGMQIPAYQGYGDTILILPSAPSSSVTPINPDRTPPTQTPTPPAPINSGDAPR